MVLSLTLLITRDMCLYVGSCSNASAVSVVDNSHLPVTSSATDLITFHERCGTLVKLTNNGRTAERQRPLDEFNNGVVMTARPLHNDERFEVSLSL